MSKKKEIVPKFRFPEFQRDGIDFVHGNKLFKSITNKNHNSDLPILAITQDQGAVPRDQIEYNVTVTDKSLSNYKVVEVGDFIISLRSFQGGIEYSRFKGICSPAYIILRKREENISELYYKYFFKTWRYIQSLNRNLEGIRDGKMISYSQFSSVKVPYPRSFKEQQKIADCLSSIDELIDAESRKLKALEKYKKGLMQKLFPAEGKTLPEWRFPEFQGCGEWKSKSIGKACKMFSGGTPDTSKKEFYGGTIPFIRSAEINKSSTELFITEEGFKNSSAKMVKKGDILIALYGANSGEVALSKIDGAINQAILCLRHETNNVFVYHYFTHMKNWIISKYIQGGQGNLSGQIIKSVNLYFPKAEEQQKIADFLSEIDTMITGQSNKVEQLKAHKKGLMQGLFPSFEEADV
ncbi:restriction endonuclease subunit S [uncultured Eubacterium sp.]|uniref:restriction endonuclease subunit S n=1 Tax=uncultured Eubacterium sp. TaxID=165185 RepID=UPI00263412B8|nr:restriction endonuclease subunit S [Ruminococcus bromii]MEE0007058.1 restriction endonuclease subunit S [Ruminococcus bromii]